MRLGVIWKPSNNAHYRAIEPLKAMERRGHQVMWPPDGDGEAVPRRLARCDVIHVYRRRDEQTRRLLAELGRRGTAITWDNDDDFTAIPRESPHYKNSGGLTGQRTFAQMLKVARLASVVTTTTELLADKYRRNGIERVEVVGNYLVRDAVRRRRRRHEGVVIGWVAGLEHVADARQLRLRDVLLRLLATHENVRVECIGVDLGLPERYRHDDVLHFSDLPHRIGGFDIGIAPLADIPFNRARSDIKLKEYAASGVPWLASPVGPYLGFGERQGGRLVPDDAWFEELERLATRPRERRRLARRAKAWAKGQTIDAIAQRWEQLFADARYGGRQAGGRVGTVKSADVV